jgi:hypothetical protein
MRKAAGWLKRQASRSNRRIGGVTRRNIFAAIFFLFFSLYICFESLRIGFGSWHKPGPGFLAFWSGIVLGSLALVTMFENGKPKEEGESSGQVSWKGRATCFLALLAYVWFCSIR